jgi:myo-inositol-1(or 4)-monophosphatase
MPLTTRYMAALHLARDAGALAHELHGHARFVAAEPATREDYALRCIGTLRALMRDTLARAFAGDAIIEDGSAGRLERLPERAWITAPIVGARNFRRGIPFYAIALAYVEHDQCEIGVVYDPEHDELFHARRGDGAFCEHGGCDERLRIAACEAPQRALVCLADDNGAPEPAYLMIRHELMDLGAAVREMGADALALAHVAAGRCDGFVGLRVDARRNFAGMLLVEEAGGSVYQAKHADRERAQGVLLATAPGIAHALSDLAQPWEVRRAAAATTPAFASVH